MDPICHTLVGASLGFTGLEKQTRYARATLIVAANLPDIDVVAHFMGETASYAFRRGITHGLPALVVLPFVLAGLVWFLGRLRPAPAKGPPVSFRGLLLLSYIGVFSHPILDWMNTYGMRWLMPIVDKFYYGDTLFIIDWIMWLVLALGLVATALIKRNAAHWYQRPASIALLAMVAYIGMNYTITQNAERAAMIALGANPPSRLLASPVPFNPLRREIVLEYADEYRFGSYTGFSGDGFQHDDQILPKGDPKNLDVARSTLGGRQFLHWARFPYSVPAADGSGFMLADARYIRDVENPRLDGFAMLAIEP